MSDSSKQRSGATATPIKNPLLSASVTGLTFDDFPNKPLLMPAAPPIVHAPPAPVVTPTSLLTREPKSLVTVGSSTLDTENLDEINLNASNEDNPPPEISDPNANPLLEQYNQGSNSDSILSQAASSFSALPSVASNVFSTFSKRITAISSRETTPGHDQYQQDTNANNFVPQLDIQPTYTQHQPQQQSGNLGQAAPPPFYAPPQGGSYFAGTPQLSVETDTQNTLAPPPEPPKLYTPGDVPAIPSGNIAPPSNLGGQNNFRFTSKKKLYAPIPGLSDQSQPPAATYDPSAVSAPITYDNSTTYGGFTSNNPYQQIPQYPTEEQYKPEERKLGGGLFSKISNFAPTGVLQNITGLVQSAAGSITQTVKPDSTANLYQNQAPPPVSFDQQSNYFAGAPPPPPTNFFVPPSFGGEQHNFQSTDTLPPPSSSSFYNTPQSSGFNLSDPPIQTVTQSTPQSTAAAVNFFNPAQSTPLFNPPPPLQSAATEGISQPQTTPQASELFQIQSTSTEQQTQIPFFNPSNLPPQANTSLSYQQTASQTSRPNRPPSRPPSHPSSSYCPQANITANDQEAVSFFNPNQATQPTEAPVAVFDPTKYLPTAPTAPPQSSQLASSNSALPPPAGGQTSYRLQKGTKLYKNPLTPQETAPIQVTPNQIQPQAPPTVYPTFASPSFVAPVPTPPNPTYFLPNQGGFPINSEPQSVPLFAPTSSVEELKPKEFVTNETNQGIELFSAPLESKENNVTQEETTPVQVSKPPELLTQVPKDIENPLPEPEVNQQTFGEDTTSSFFFKPIDPVPNTFSEILNPTPTIDVTNIIDNKEEETPFLETIEPVIEETITTETVSSKIDLKPEQTIQDPLEQTLQKLSLTTESATGLQILNPPPPTTQPHTTNNPYRRGSTSETVKPQVSQQPILANFFTPGPFVAGSGDLHFFPTLGATESGSTKTDSGVNFFSDPPLIEKETETATLQQQQLTKPASFFQPSIRATTDFFTATQTEAKVSSINFENKPDLIPQIPQTTQEVTPSNTFFPPLPTNIDVIPSVLENKEDINNKNEQFLQTNVPPPIGFESFLQQAPQPTPPVAIVPENTTLQQEITTPPQQPEIVNRFSNYFNQIPQIQTEIIPKDPSTFFDSFAGQQSQPQLQQQPQQQAEVPNPSVANNEEQRIQFFFNNPPPKDASAAGDLNYDLVHSGLAIKNLQQRSLTPISNLVEPPSSACSEFSELSNSTAGQKSIAADLSIIESGVEKPIIKEVEKLVNTNPSLVATPTIDNNTKHIEELPEEILKELRMANLLSGDKVATTPTASVSYKPAVKHWFYKSEVTGKIIWVPFSHYDSALLETSLLMEGDEKPNIVAVEGGRYDVNISERKKMSVYWDSEPIEVRRCSWFYKAVDSKYVPYEEQTAEVLESEYKQAAESGVWHKTIILGMGEQVVFHGPTVIVHFQQQQNTDAWGGNTQTSTRPRVVKRDLDDFNIEQGESQKVDHLLFMVHGIGSACDLKLRSVEEVVEDFRTIARQLVQSHYKNSTDLGLVGRVEVLPISWHSHLHSAEMGIDEKLRMITLESIPKLRNFTNDTLLDILFYTSPTFCQKIMNTIVSSMNDMYVKYRERHPEFNGGVSLAGHSLGSLILFDLLCHQHPIKESEEKNLENPDQQFLTGSSSTSQMDSNQLEDKQIGYAMGSAGTGQPFIDYGQLIFQPKKFFALGSPIGMFVTIRGIDKLGLDFRLPTCPGFYNIFHPYDPVAYRIEALVNTDLSGVRPVLIPHHKGRKRMHLELRETMTRVSMDLKNRFLDKFKTTLDGVNIFGTSTKSKKEAEELMEKEVDKVIQMQMQLEHQTQDKLSPPSDDSQNAATTTTLRPRTDSISTVLSDDMVEIDLPLGKLNDSKRIDYVLQEAPLEFINEYIFALSSHVCYWDSEDTILFVMKEIYSGLGISPDSQVPQQTMTIERPSSRNSLL